MNLDKTLTIDDLITAFVEYEEYKNWHESYTELIGYYQKQLELMQNLFGVNFEKAKKQIDELKKINRGKFNPSDYEVEKYYEFNARDTIEVFENCIKLLNSFKSPFDYRGLLAGMPPKICRDLMQKYEDDLSHNILNLESTYRNIAKELLIFMFPEIESKKIEGKKLYQLGLPEEVPDLADFF